MSRRPTDRRGVALPLTLMVLMLLSALALLLLSMSPLEPLISKNLAAAEQARSLAEAGIEWAFNTLGTSLDWNAFLKGADPGRGVVLIADSPLPGGPASEGTYTVRVRNDSLAGDQQITGVPPDAGGPSDDTNSLLIITGVGNAGHGSRTLEAVLRRIELPPVAAALAFPGRRAAVNVSGSFEIDGNDSSPDGTPGSCAPVFGISVSSGLPASAPGSNEAIIESALASSPPASVKGKRQDPGGPDSGANTIAADGALTPSRVQAFVGAARKADVVFESSEPAGLFFGDIGAGCASSWSSSACWGTRERPKVIYVKGNPDPTSAVLRVQLSGNTEGYGILIVEDGELTISGNFLWRGLIVVTGSRAALGFLGGGSQSVYGSVVVNDAGLDPGAGKGFLTGNGRLRYSCQALDRSRTARRLLTLRSWREVAD
ncbi:MAG: hypothetical protein HY613_12020 [Candidatus Rokubacteria bacterium]|nr:hypothetical protein [Candidatus Rokubacteria bacterium]